jgi:hypothetical protein
LHKIRKTAATRIASTSGTAAGLAGWANRRIDSARAVVYRCSTSDSPTLASAVMVQRIQESCRPAASPTTEPGAPAASSAADRRVWIRHRTHVPAACGHAKDEEAPVPAVVGDISRGGISLIVDRLFAPGALVSVELPGAPDGSASTVLAHVIRVTATDDNQWALGCAFAAELNENELAVFGAEKVRPRANDDRGWMRYPCDLPVFYDVIADDEALPTPARLVNISAGGVALQLPRPVEVGTVLTLELPGPPDRECYRMLACVVRLNGPVAGPWQAGCTFIRELSEAELEPVLTAAGNPQEEPVPRTR